MAKCGADRRVVFLALLTACGCTHPAPAQTAKLETTDAGTSCFQPGPPFVSVDYITHIGAVLVDSQSICPSYPLKSSGSLPSSGEAVFKVYALTDDPRFGVEVTEAFHRRHAVDVGYGWKLLVRVRQMPSTPGNKVHGTFRLEVDGTNGYQIIFKPERGFVGTRTADVRFEWIARAPRFPRKVVLRSDFHLAVPGLQGS